MKVNAQWYPKLVLKVMKHDLLVTKNALRGKNIRYAVKKWQVAVLDEK